MRLKPPRGFSGLKSCCEPPFLSNFFKPSVADSSLSMSAAILLLLTTWFHSEDPSTAPPKSGCQSRLAIRMAWESKLPLPVLRESTRLLCIGLLPSPTCPSSGLSYAYTGFRVNHRSWVEFKSSSRSGTTGPCDDCTGCTTGFCTNGAWCTLEAAATEGGSGLCGTWGFRASCGHVGSYWSAP